MTTKGVVKKAQRETNEILAAIQDEQIKTNEALEALGTLVEGQTAMLSELKLIGKALNQRNGASSS